MDILKCHNHSLHIKRWIYRFGMYATHALYKRPPYAIESRCPPRIRGMCAVHTPLAPWIRHGQVLIRDIIRSGIAIHTPYAPHVRHPCAIDTQLIRNTCQIVAPEIFHQTISAISLRICSFCVAYQLRINGAWVTHMRRIWRMNGDATAYDVACENLTIAYSRRKWRMHSVHPTKNITKISMAHLYIDLKCLGSQK